MVAVEEIVSFLGVGEMIRCSREADTFHERKGRKPDFLRNGDNWRESWTNA